jgi:hypothetical protein
MSALENKYKKMQEEQANNEKKVKQDLEDSQRQCEELDKERAYEK